LKFVLRADSLETVAGRIFSANGELAKLFPDSGQLVHAPRIPQIMLTNQPHFIPKVTAHEKLVLNFADG